MLCSNNFIIYIYVITKHSTKPFTSVSNMILRRGYNNYAAL